MDTPEHGSATAELERGREIKRNSGGGLREGVWQEFRGFESPCRGGGNLESALEYRSMKRRSILKGMGAGAVVSAMASIQGLAQTAGTPCALKTAVPKA